VLIILPSQELAHENPISKGNITIELRKLCGKHHIVPKSYKLEGVVKEGELPQHRQPTGMIEIWKGRYNDEAVALKVLRVPPGDPQIRGIKSVSTLFGPSRVGLFDYVLIDGVAVLQGSGIDDAAQARKYSPFLRGIDDCIRLLPGISLVQEREYHGLSEGGAERQSVRSG